MIQTTRTQLQTVFCISPGNTDIVRMLLKSRADPYKLIGGQTIIDLARDFDHQEILTLLMGSE